MREARKPGASELLAVPSPYTSQRDGWAIEWRSMPCQLSRRHNLNIRHEIGPVVPSFSCAPVWPLALQIADRAGTSCQGTRCLASGDTSPNLARQGQRGPRSVVDRDLQESRKRGGRLTRGIVCDGAVQATHGSTATRLPRRLEANNSFQKNGVPAEPRRGGTRHRRPGSAGGAIAGAVAANLRVVPEHLGRLPKAVRLP